MNLLRINLYAMVLSPSGLPKTARARQVLVNVDATTARPNAVVDGGDVFAWFSDQRRYIQLEHVIRAIPDHEVGDEQLRRNRHSVDDPEKTL